MTMTPWGDASTLRERQLSPGKGTPRAEVERNQRERLFAALVAVAAEKGYASTSVADLAELSGVSSRSFYELFADKDACLLAALEEILAGVNAEISSRLSGENPWEERARQAVEAFAEMVMAQPAAARLCLVEAFAAGPAARQRIDDAIENFAELIRHAFDRLPERRGMPAELTWAMIGGVAHTIYRRLVAGRLEEIPGLVPALYEWVVSLPPPPQPLRAKGRRRLAGGGTPPFAAHVPGERVLRGFATVVAEKGYAAATVAEVATAARISPNTFYAHFKDKEDALLAALDSSGAQMVAATLPAVRRSSDWPDAVRVALESLCAFLAAEPAFAHLRGVEVYSVGPWAVEKRDRATMEILEVVLRLTEKEPPPPGPVEMEAMLGAIDSLLYRQLRNGSPKNLVEVAPLATYLVLAPWIGAEAASAAALG